MLQNLQEGRQTREEPTDPTITFLVDSHSDEKKTQLL